MNRRSNFNWLAIDSYATLNEAITPPIGYLIYNTKSIRPYADKNALIRHHTHNTQGVAHIRNLSKSRHRDKTQHILRSCIILLDVCIPSGAILGAQLIFQHPLHPPRTVHPTGTVILTLSRGQNARNNGSTLSIKRKLQSMYGSANTITSDHIMD